MAVYPAVIGVQSMRQAPQQRVGARRRIGRRLFGIPTDVRHDDPSQNRAVGDRRTAPGPAADASHRPYG
jgi:hypothetical protein